MTRFLALRCHLVAGFQAALSEAGSNLKVLLLKSWRRVSLGVPIPSPAFKGSSCSLNAFPFPQVPPKRP